MFWVITKRTEWMDGSVDTETVAIRTNGGAAAESCARRNVEAAAWNKHSPDWVSYRVSGPHPADEDA